MHAFIGFKKSGLFAAFFLISALLTSAIGSTLPERNIPNVADRLKTAAMSTKLYQLPVWSGLVQSENGRSQISDANFLLSLPNFSPAREMQQTIEFLYNGENNNVCRFPARYLWLRQQLDAPDLPLDSCADIVEFRQKAPLDEIALVFASEMISQPASMLGHAFLKFSGKNKSGQDVSHAISFYTDADTYNIPKLLFDSLVIGKKGYFSLSPYYEKQKRYVDEEQRNVWEYKLKLNEFQKELIRLHIIELKQSHLTYYFQKYNCATVLNFIITLADKSMPENDWWVTPKDVIKHANQTNLIENTQVTTPNKWLYRALANQVSPEDQQAIRHLVEEGNLKGRLDISGSNDAFIRLELARTYNQYAYLKSGVDKKLWADNEKVISDVKEQYFLDKSLIADNRYNPLNTPGDSQITYASKFDEDGTSLVFTVLPISHTLSDDNRNYASETSLQLLAISIKLNPHNVRPELNQLTVFDMISLLPYDEITGGTSTQFRIAVEPQRNNKFEMKRVVTLNGAIGLTKRVAQDVDIYMLAGGGLGYTEKNGYLYSTVESGAILREVWDMKTIFSVMRTNNQINIGSNFYTIRLNQSKFINNTKSLNFDWKTDCNGRYKQNIFEITLKKIF